MPFTIERQKPFIFLILLVIITGCAATKPGIDPNVIKNAVTPAYSIGIHQPNIVVAVSPVRQTMQIGGSIPTVLGAGISAIQDGRYSERIQAVSEGYDFNQVFLDMLSEDLNQLLGDSLKTVMPKGTSAGYHNAREAREARLEALRKNDLDLVLDLKYSYGIYGPEGILITRIAGELTDVPSGKVLWRNTVSNYSLELFTDLRWRDPTQRMTPNYFSPRLTSADDAIDQWIVGNGEHLRQSYEASVRATLAALFTELNLENSSAGQYVLGVQSLLDKDYDKAEAHLNAAWELSPENQADLHNALAIALARNGKVNKAIEILEGLVETEPEYLPARYNLAWWYAVEEKQPEKAQSHFDKAVELGARPSRRLERAMR